MGAGPRRGHALSCGVQARSNTLHSRCCLDGKSEGVWGLPQPSLGCCGCPRWPSPCRRRFARRSSGPQTLGRGRQCQCAAVQQRPGSGGQGTICKVGRWAKAVWAQGNAIAQGARTRLRSRRSPKFESEDQRGCQTHTDTHLEDDPYDLLAVIPGGPRVAEAARACSGRATTSGGRA